MVMKMEKKKIYRGKCVSWGNEPGFMENLPTGVIALGIQIESGPCIS